jgi:Ca2+-binding RTX toxin-like protein
MLTLAAITAVVLTVGAGGTRAEEGIHCVSGKVCKGTGGPDVIVGTNKNDDINPFGGDDTVYANGGGDNVRHSYGDDTIWGGTGADTLRGGFGLDHIYGNTARAPGDGVRDLIDCAYLGSRGDPGPDEGFGDPYPTDIVVDCSNRDNQ